MLSRLFAPALVLFALAVAGCGSDASDGGQDVSAVADAPEADGRSGDDGDARAPDEEPYDFANPTAAFSLPAVLREISGLTLLDDAQLGAIQDEEGDLYAIRMEDGEPVGRIRFARGGDYEGLERVGDLVYVIQSDGDLFELRNWNRGDFPDTRNFETRLGAKACDAEGLATDGTRLFIACKEEDKDENTRVYAFDPARALTSLYLAVSRDDVPGKGALRASALAVHPITGHLVLLCSGRERLVSVTADGTVADVWDYSDADLEQPEGLVFLPNGDMFLSSEGKSAAAQVVRFDYRPVAEAEE